MFDNNTQPFKAGTASSKASLASFRRWITIIKARLWLSAAGYAIDDTRLISNGHAQQLRKNKLV
jgi:hypothetical protein